MRPHWCWCTGNIRSGAPSAAGSADAFAGYESEALSTRSCGCGTPDTTSHLHYSALTQNMRQALPGCLKPSVNPGAEGQPNNRRATDAGPCQKRDIATSLVPSATPSWSQHCQNLRPTRTCEAHDQGALMQRPVAITHPRDFSSTRQPRHYCLAKHPTPSCTRALGECLKRRPNRVGPPPWDRYHRSAAHEGRIDASPRESNSPNTRRSPGYTPPHFRL